MLRPYQQPVLSKATPPPGTSQAPSLSVCGVAGRTFFAATRKSGHGIAGQARSSASVWPAQCTQALGRIRSKSDIGGTLWREHAGQVRTDASAIGQKPLRALAQADEPLAQRGGIIGRSL